MTDLDTLITDLRAKAKAPKNFFVGSTEWTNSIKDLAGACDPTTILTILAALDEARGEVERLSSEEQVAARSYPDHVTLEVGLRDRIAKKDAELATLRAKLAEVKGLTVIHDAEWSKIVRDLDDRAATLRAENEMLKRANVWTIQRENETLRAEVEQYKTILANPIAVYHNMLRGTIATPEHFARYETQLSELRAEVERLRGAPTPLEITP